jgi:dTDP-4-amino-4,6-dideoxygalactose transaminase
MSENATDRPGEIVLGQPRFSEEEIAAVASVLRSGWIGPGPWVERFEEAFAAYQGCRHAVSLASCSSALLLALRASGVGAGDEVITGALTFPATVNAILECGAKPVIVDIEPEYCTLDLRQVRQLIGPRTRAVIPVHLAGAPANVAELLELRRHHNLLIVHDCAHAIETAWDGRRLGSFADIACYSFYATKNLTTGEGGMLCTDDRQVAERVRRMAFQGLNTDTWKRFSRSEIGYDVVSSGFKLYMTDLQATLGLAQLKTLEERQERRRRVWDQYRSALAGLPIALPLDPAPTHTHARHLFRVGIPADRDRVLLAMRRRGIGCGIHYPSLAAMTFYRETLGWRPEDYPRTQREAERTLSLPISSYFREGDAERVAGGLQEALRES